MNKPAAIYARVSSDRQKENHTIASQTAALIEYAQTHEYSVPQEWIFQDEGYSGAILLRPGLEALRDLAAEGQIAAALVYSPDRRQLLQMGATVGGLLAHHEKALAADSPGRLGTPLGPYGERSPFEKAVRWRR